MSSANMHRCRCGRMSSSRPARARPTSFPRAGLKVRAALDSRATMSRFAGLPRALPPLDVKERAMRNEDAAKVLQAVRDLAPALSSRSAEIEEARRLPADLLGQLKAAGC